MSSPSISNIEDYLLKANSNNSDERTQAYKSLEALQNSDLAQFLIGLGNVLSNESKQTNIRQLSAILIKNTLIHSQQSLLIWKNNISAEQKNNIKLLVLSTLASNIKEIRTSASTVIASICKIDSPIKVTWPNLIQSLTKNAFNDDINLKLSAIETLGYVCEELTNKTIESSDIDSIMNALIQNLNNEANNGAVILQVLKALSTVIKLSEKNFSNEKERDIIMNSIFTIGTKYEKEEQILNKLAILFIEIFSISNYYDYMEKYIDNIFNFSIGLAKSKKETNENLALLGLEIVCCIGDEESTRLNQLTLKLRQTKDGLFMNNGQKVSKGYLNKYNEILQKYIVDNVGVPENDEDESEWNISKACLYILTLMMKNINQENILIFITNLQMQIEKSLNNIDERCKCWLLLGSCLQTNYKKDIIDLILSKINYIIKDINVTSDIKLRKCSSFLLKRISKYYSKIFDGQKLGNLIGCIISSININGNNSDNIDQFVIANLCQTLQNLIKTFGDRETTKNTNQISPFFSNILMGLYSPSETDILLAKNESEKISVSRLLTVKSLIEYSSNDCQDKLYEVLIQYLKEIEYTHSKMNELISKGASTEIIYKFQEYYYTILQTLFKKYKKEIIPSLSLNIWRLTELLFSNRHSVFAEANLALAALAPRATSSFPEIFPKIFGYIEFSVFKYNEPGLSKSALVLLQASIRALGEKTGNVEIGKDNTNNEDNNNLSSFYDKIMDILVKVCTANEAKRDEKNVAVSCLGEIALAVGVKVVGRLKEIMGLLMSAAQMGLNVPEDADDDYIEFVKELRYELIITFTCFELSLEDNTKEFIPYVPGIFNFFNSLLSDSRGIKPETLKSMLSFICDMIKIYGREILPVCNQEFAEKLFRSLNQFDLVKKDGEVEQNLEILKMLYK